MEIDINGVEPDQTIILDEPPGAALQETENEEVL